MSGETYGDAGAIDLERDAEEGVEVVVAEHELGAHSAVVSSDGELTVAHDGTERELGIRGAGQLRDVGEQHAQRAARQQGDVRHLRALQQVGELVGAAGREHATLAPHRALLAQPGERVHRLARRESGAERVVVVHREVPLLDHERVRREREVMQLAYEAVQRARRRSREPAQQRRLGARASRLGQTLEDGAGEHERRGEGEQRRHEVGGSGAQRDEQHQAHDGGAQQQAADVARPPGEVRVLLGAAQQRVAEEQRADGAEPRHRPPDVEAEVGRDERQAEQGDEQAGAHQPVLAARQAGAVAAREGEAEHAHHDEERRRAERSSATGSCR